MLGGTSYRVIEANDDITRCVKLRRVYGSSNEYEEVDDEPPIDIRVGQPDLNVKTNNSKHMGNNSIQYSNDGNSNNNMGSLNIEDGRMHGKTSNSNNNNSNNNNNNSNNLNNNDYYQLNNTSNDNNSNKCGCKPCILNIWIWFIIWVLALGGVAAPAVGMFKFYPNFYNCNKRIYHYRT